MNITIIRLHQTLVWDKSWFYYRLFFRVSCLMAAKWLKMTTGTTKAGSQLKGKYNTAILGCPKAKR